MNSKRHNQLARRLMKKEYRESFVDSHIRNGLAIQIREMRDARGLSQKELARLICTKQSGISRLEDPDYGNHSIRTLTRLANCFDVGLQVRFVPFSQLLDDVCSVSTETLNVSTFDDEKPGLMDACATMGTNRSASVLSIFPREEVRSDNIQNEWIFVDSDAVISAKYKAH